ncbi:MAG: hypothetical protein HS120_10955 [Burkholderiales bacterium]|nr:hypothetical protein [Burkholderiales bacterium]
MLDLKNLGDAAARGGYGGICSNITAASVGAISADYAGAAGGGDQLRRTLNFDDL